LMREEGLLYWKSTLQPSKESALRNTLQAYTCTY
jgi:hypothetical protein